MPYRLGSPVTSKKYAAQTVKFSLIIPVAPERKAEILASIEQLDYPKEAFESVVARGANPSENRNRGAARARGDILVFLDDDATLPADYLRQAETFFATYPGIDIVGGPQLTSAREPGFGRISWYALSSIFGAWKVSTRYAVKKVMLTADETAVSSANLLCRRRVLETVGFDTSLFPGEDPKFIADAARAGFHIAYSPNIVLYHRRRPTLPTLMRQIFSYGQARPRKETWRQTMTMPFFFLPSLLVCYVLGLIVLVSVRPQIIRNPLAVSQGFQGTPALMKILFLPLVLYAAAAVFFGIYEAWRHRDIKAVFFLPLIYPAIHLSYGLGMIWGYIRKAAPGRDLSI